jgi:hypothetical protein
MVTKLLRREEVRAVLVLVEDDLSNAAKVGLEFHVSIAGRLVRMRLGSNRSSGQA